MAAITRSVAASSRESSTRKLGSLSSRPSANMRWARDRTASALNSENAAAVSSVMDQGSKTTLNIDRAAAQSSERGLPASVVPANTIREGLFFHYFYMCYVVV